MQFKKSTHCRVYELSTHCRVYEHIAGSMNLVVNMIYIQLSQISPFSPHKITTLRQ
jgi:hypothetical protein